MKNEIAAQVKERWLYNYVQLKKNNKRKKVVMTCIVKDKKGKECGAMVALDDPFAWTVFDIEHGIEGNLHKQPISFLQWLCS
jgi:hypothetical protein